MCTAVRIAHKLTSWQSPTSIHCEGQLRQHIVLSAIGFTLAGIWILWMGHNAPMHMAAPDPDVTFEFTCPPPEPRYHASDAFTPLRLEEGRRAALSNAEKIAAKQGTADHNQIAQPKVRLAEAIPTAPVQVSHLAAPEAPAINAMAQPARAANPLNLMPAANAATAGGGTSDGAKGASGAGGSGMGAASGDQNSLMGGDFGVQQAMTLKSPSVAMGNIKPYKLEVLSRIKRSWATDARFDTVSLEITIDHSGKLLSKELLTSTGNAALDQSLLAAVDATEFPALPDWFKGNQLKIKLNLTPS